MRLSSPVSGLRAGAARATVTPFSGSSGQTHLERGGRRLSSGRGQTRLTFNVSALRITSSSNRVSAGPMISASIVSISLSTDEYSMGSKTQPVLDPQVLQHGEGLLALPR